MPCIAHRLHAGQTLSVGVVAIGYFNVLTGGIPLILPHCFTMINLWEWAIASHGRLLVPPGLLPESDVLGIKLHDSL